MRNSFQQAQPEERIESLEETVQDSSAGQTLETEYSEDESDNDMEEEEWETVDVPVHSPTLDDEDESPMPTYKDVEVVFEAPRAVLK